VLSQWDNSYRYSCFSNWFTVFVHAFAKHDDDEEKKKEQVVPGGAGTAVSTSASHSCPSYHICDCGDCAASLRSWDCGSTGRLCGL